MAARANTPAAGQTETTIENRIGRCVLEDAELDAMTGGTTSSAPQVYAIGRIEARFPTAA